MDITVIIDKYSRITALPIPNDAVNYVKSFVSTHDLAALPDGKYPLEGDAFVNVMTVTTKPKSSNRMEYHEKYADIQCVISGAESFIGAERQATRPLTDYSAEKDVGFVEADDESVTAFTLNEGDIVFFPPREPHFACIAAEKSITVKKAVFKIPM